jgi:hypothetical protein
MVRALAKEWVAIARELKEEITQIPDVARHGRNAEIRVCEHHAKQLRKALRQCANVELSDGKSHSDQRLVGQHRKTCQWTEDENGPHQTECGHAFEFTYDGVEANGFKYCCFCGGSIIVKLANAGTQRLRTADSTTIEGGTRS